MSRESNPTQALLARLWADHPPQDRVAVAQRPLQRHLRDDEAAALLDGHGEHSALLHATVCEPCQQLLLLADDLDLPPASRTALPAPPAALVLEVTSDGGTLALHSCSGVHRVRPALAARRGTHDAVVSVRDHAAAGRLEVDLYADKDAGATAVVRWRGEGATTPTTASLRGPGPGHHLTTLEHGVATLPIAGPGRWTMQLWDDEDTLCATIVLGWRAADAETE